MWNHGPRMGRQDGVRSGVQRPVLDLDEQLSSGISSPISRAGPRRDRRKGAGVCPAWAAPRSGGCSLPKGLHEAHGRRRGRKVGPDLVERGVRQETRGALPRRSEQASPAMAAAMKERNITLPQLSPSEMATTGSPRLCPVRYFGNGGNIQRRLGGGHEQGMSHARCGERGKPGERRHAKWRGSRPRWRPCSLRSGIMPWSGTPPQSDRRIEDTEAAAPQSEG